MTELFKLGLGLGAPLTIKSVRLDPKLKRLDIVVGFPRGSTFPCPEGQAECKVYDTEERTWRHWNFFEYVTHLQPGQPRTDCPIHGKNTVDVPWARPGTHFTLLFEARVFDSVARPVVDGGRRYRALQISSSDDRVLLEAVSRGEFATAVGWAERLLPVDTDEPLECALGELRLERIEAANARQAAEDDRCRVGAGDNRRLLA